MAWTSMHFATGMCGASVLAGTTCLIWRRGYRFLPLAMTVGGLWGILPDLPRVFREDFPSLPFAQTLGSTHLERWLHSIGDLFFFHARLDNQPHEYSLLGLFAIILMYNISIVLLLILEYRQRNSIANRSWRTHEAILNKLKQDPITCNEDNENPPEDDCVIGRIYFEKEPDPPDFEQFPRISS